MSHEFVQTKVFRSTLRLLPEIAYGGMKDTSPQSKKEARKQISLEKTSENLGFLHAVLIKVDGRYFLLAGPSGIGKSTYANSLHDSSGAVILANDWVAVEKEEGHFFASDLNFSTDLRHSERCLLSGIILLSREDEFKRDAFVPNAAELEALLTETFDTSSSAEVKRLGFFWLHNQAEFPVICAIPARHRSETETAATIFNILKRELSMSKTQEVGVIGIGSIGTELAFQLGQRPDVEKVHLFNRSSQEAIGVALDMNQALLKDRNDVFVAHTEPGAVFSMASSVFFAFRDEQNAQVAHDLPERWQKLPRHLEILKEYVKILSETGFAGTIFMITNPVDILTYALYALTQSNHYSLRTYQVYGAGLEVDLARAQYHGKHRNPDLQPENIQIYGNHSDEFFIKTPLSHAEDAEILRSVKNSSKEIRQYVPRTIFGPVASVIRSFQSFTNGGDTHLTLLQEGGHIGRKVTFRNQLPMLPGRIQGSEYLQIVKQNVEALSKLRI